MDMAAYDSAKLEAQRRSQGGGGGVDDQICLDVHAIDYLQKQGVKPTDDSHKYNYTADQIGNYSKNNNATVEVGYIGSLRTAKFIPYIRNAATRCAIFEIRPKSGDALLRRMSPYLDKRTRAIESRAIDLGRKSVPMILMADSNSG